jgi:hypothetical protein
MHRTCHASADVLLLRRSSEKSPDIDSRIQSIVDALFHSNEQWRQRKFIKEADEMERRDQPVQPFETSANPNFLLGISMIFPTNPPSLSNVEDSSMQFLDYPSVHLTNLFYANLLNHWRSIQICISLIAQPIWGTTYPGRLECAIDICRTHAALGKERNFLTTGKIWGLHLAGIVFGGPQLYPVVPLSPRPTPPLFAFKLTAFAMCLVCSGLMVEGVAMGD